VLYLSASAVVIHYEDALYQVYARLPLPLPFFMKTFPIVGAQDIKNSAVFFSGFVHVRNFPNISRQQRPLATEGVEIIVIKPRP